MKNISIILLFCVYALGVSAISAFFEKGQRPEIFELTDNEVAVFKVTLPDEDFALLKEKADVPGLSPPVTNLTYELENYRLSLKYSLDIFNEIFKINFTELFPNIDVKKELSGLYIGQDGYPNVDEIINNLDFDPKNYIDFDFAMDNIENHLLVNGKHNYMELIMKLVSLITEKMNSENDIIIDGENITNDLKTARTIAATILESNIQNADTQVNPGLGNLFNFNINESLLEELLGQYYSINGSTDFKTKNGTLTVNIKGEEKSFDKITFSLSGQYSRSLVKPNFNLKIRGKKDLFGRSQFKLRSDFTEPTFLRSKLTSDIHKKMGLTSILANYATLYINEEYMGLFVLTDAYKLPWVEQVYGEKDTTHLYKCENSAFLNIDSGNACENENDEIEDPTEMSIEWSNFLQTIFNAQSAEDLEDVFEVDHFIKEMAIEYLLGAWDHLQLGHNFYLYKQPNGKWIYMTYDHDHTFGINLDRIFYGALLVDLPERMEKFNFDYPNYSFSEWTKQRHLIDILILNDPTRFNQAIKEIVETVFNPATLFPHIDELKEFIRPYAEKDYTPDENGNYPGRINDLANNPYTFEHWEANSEFTSVTTLQYNAYGIKYWILAKYRNVCKTYDLECDPVCLDENYKFDVDENVEFKGYDFSNVDLSNLPYPEYSQYQSMIYKIISFNEPIPTSTIVESIPTSTIVEPSSIETIVPTEVETDSYSNDEYEIEDDIDVEEEIDSGSETETDII